MNLDKFALLKIGLYVGGGVCAAVAMKWPALSGYFTPAAVGLAAYATRSPGDTKAASTKGE